LVSLKKAGYEKPLFRWGTLGEGRLSSHDETLVFFVGAKVKGLGFPGRLA